MNQNYKKYRVYQPTTRRLRTDIKKNRHTFPAKAVFIVVLLAFIPAAAAYYNHSSKVAAREAALAAEVQRISRQKNFAAGLGTLVQKNGHLQLAVAAVDIKTGRSYAAGTQTPVVAASTTKLITACLYLKGVESGKYSLGDKVLGYSGREALRLLINRSHDGVWQEFNRQLRHKGLSEYARGLGITDYNPDTNRIGAAGLARLMSKMYSGDLLNAAHTDMLLSFMQKTNYENFIPPAVPSHLKLYHKVGLFEDQVNDAAIISDGKNHFVLVILTNGGGSHNWSERAELMQDITRRAVVGFL